MNTMKNMPGFSAEASIYKRSGHYYVTKTLGTLAGAQIVLPQLMATNVSCSGTNGDKCYCPTGCKQRTNGTCCCTADEACGNKFSDVFSGGGGVFSGGF